MSLQCNKCEKVFKSKQSLSYHTKNNVCKKHKYICEQCNSEISSKQMLKYHIDNKVCQKKTDKTEKYKIELKKADQYIRNLENENFFLKGENKALKENPQMINNIEKQQINVIFPQAFGTEEVDYILSKIPNLLHDAFGKHTSRSIEYITEKIHCNKEVFPEYTNVYIKGYKSPFALVSDGMKFQHKPQKRIIDQIIEKSAGMIQDYADENGEKYGQKIIDKYQRYIDLVDMDGRDKENGHGKKNMVNTKKSERRKDLEVEIAGLLLDMRGVIESDGNMKMMLDKLEEGEFASVD